MDLTKHFPYDRKTNMDLFEKYRTVKVLNYPDGNLLDIGCGFNNLVRSYRKRSPSSLSVGLDIYNWYGRPDIMADGRYIPIMKGTFQSTSFVATLNHIVDVEKAIKEARRVLVDSGRVYVTMISPIVGKIIHMLFDRDGSERGLKEGEKVGMSKQELVKLFQSSNFRLIEESKFDFGLNTLYVFQKQR